MMPGQGAYYQQSPHPQAHHPQQYLQPQPHHPPPHHPHHPLPHAHPHHAAMQTPQRPPPSQRQPGPTPTGHYMQMGTPAGSSGAGPSSAKRARTTPSAASMSGAGPSNALIGAQDAPEDEEDTSRGDLFDHIPARDISTHRYKQHHEWFEEVFTSPYGSSDITPGSIGLEQLGEWIKPLIDGLLDKEGNPAAGKSYNETLRAVAERARAENAKIKAQMDEMERIHTRRLEEFHAGRLLLDADKELRSAILNEQLTPLGFTLPEADFDTISNPRPIADIIADVESKSGIKIVEFNEQNGARCWNIQPEVVAYEEAQAREAAAAAAHVVATTSGNTPSGASGKGSNEMEKDNAMAGVAASESTSPDNARYLVPVVIEKADTNTGSSSSSAHLPPNATIAAPRAATDHDTVMSQCRCRCPRPCCRARGRRSHRRCRARTKFQTVLPEAMRTTS
ncbi:hypothetical protein DRE_03951 [Drechslerella stenobrocha 248]|uniref:SWI/SNF and RSC complexes subunit Ssr4 C-terminal domain-containing protein n=1 Tax=Drechslerella stenobrocha 248 TaxID=1043628 RepID=W7HRN6_9PEZI|nr:hypothetical protein DRE_03951 [Drechslerella stenobrocha 248]